MLSLQILVEDTKLTDFTMIANYLNHFFWKSQNKNKAAK